jgi:protein-S-isoprenylcysteine O-methyltransferase Ste14
LGEAPQYSTLGNEECMTYDQVFLGSVLAIFLVTFVATLVFVQRRGHDVKGVIEGHVGGAIVTSGASLLWLVVVLFYIFEVHSVAWFGRIPWLDNGVVKGVGITSSTVGLVVGVAGEMALGESFRLALPTGKTRLVTRGIYRYVRNPCVLGTLLLVLGTFLIAPSWLAFGALVANIIGYEMKVQAEEAYLRLMHGHEYEVYCARTGRYLPLVGRREER